MPRGLYHRFMMHSDNRSVRKVFRHSLPSILAWTDHSLGFIEQPGMPCAPFCDISCTKTGSRHDAYIAARSTGLAAIRRVGIGQKIDLRAD